MFMVPLKLGTTIINKKQPVDIKHIIKSLLHQFNIYSISKIYLIELLNVFNVDHSYLMLIY